VLSREHLDLIKDELSGVRPMPAVFFPEFVKRLRGENVKPQTNKMELAEAVREDVRNFKQQHGVSRCVAVWCGSTEVHHEPKEVHSSLAHFEQGLRKSDPNISPSMVYAYALMKEGVGYANGAPNLTAEIPALTELARDQAVSRAQSLGCSGRSQLEVPTGTASCFTWPSGPSVPHLPTAP